jgi:hypothetical protein
MTPVAAIPVPTPAGGVLAIMLCRLGTVPLLLTGLAIVATVVFGELPGDGRYSGVLQDSCHAPAFAALASIMFALLARHSRRSPAADEPRTRAIVRTALVQAFAVVGVMLCLGAATEILQGMLGRDAEVDDVISDVIGASGVAALWVYATLQGNPHPSARFGRGVALLACAVLAVCWAAPSVRCGLGYWARDARFPVLAQFQSQRDLYFVAADPGPARIVPNQQQAAGGPSAALRVPLDRGRWPGLTLTEVVPDWRGFHTIALDLENPGTVELSLRLRVNDRAHNGAFDDRFNTRLMLLPLTRSTVEIPLEQIAASPRTRRMDLGQMAEIILFRDGGAPGQAVLVERIWLR